MTINFAARMVHVVTVAAMLALAIAAAVLATRSVDVRAPSALVFGLTSVLFATAGLWSLLRGALALIRAASMMIPVYIAANIVVQSRAIADDWVDADLYRALAIEGVVIWAALLAGGLLMLRAGAPNRAVDMRGK